METSANDTAEPADKLISVHLIDRLHSMPKDIIGSMRNQICSQGEVDIAIAFWGSGAVDELGLAAPGVQARILLNSESGACNPRELRRLLECAKANSHLSIRVSPRLHAKTVVSNSSILVGSANASANGLGFQGRQLDGWLEACLESRDPKLIENGRNWFERVWNGQPALDDNCIERAEALWKRRRQLALLARDEGSRRLDEVDGAPIYVVLVDEDAELDLPAVRKGAKAAKLPIQKLDWFESWDKMPIDALLLTFEINVDGTGCKFDGAFSTSSPVRSFVVGDKTVYPVFKVNPDTLGSHGFEEKSLKKLNKVIECVVAKLKENPKTKASFGQDSANQYVESTDWCISLFDFVTFCNEEKIPMPEGIVAA